MRQGIYRLVHFPAGEHEDLVVAPLWFGLAGVVSHQSALALHGLADALPAHIHLTLPSAWRHRRFRVPADVVRHHDEVLPDDRAWFGAVPTTHPRRSLDDCARDLARVVAALRDAATLKAALVLKVRLERARTTKDVDLRVVGSPVELLAKFQDAARRDLGDFMTFEVGRDEHHPEIQNDGMLYEGLRFRAACWLAGKVYGQPFGVDVGAGPRR